MSTHPTNGPVHEWFGLSYSNYQVLPRTLMQSMPIGWQERMVACLTELRDAFEHVPQAEVYEVQAATEHIVEDMAPSQLTAAGITADYTVHPGNPDGAPTYHRDGEELDAQARVLLPTVDPVPHYGRGRTYIEPRTAEAAR